MQILRIPNPIRTIFTPSSRFVLLRLEIRRDFFEKIHFYGGKYGRIFSNNKRARHCRGSLFYNKTYSLCRVKLIRYAVGENTKFEKFVPLIAATLVVIFAVICFFALPKVTPADNVVIAIVIGAASGFTAIGTDQMVKQFGKNGDNSKATAKDKNDEEKIEKGEKNSAA